MKARAIVGKTVESIDQTTFFNRHLGKMDVYVTSIRFTDGTVLVPQPSDDGYDLFVDFVVRKQK